MSAAAWSACATLTLLAVVHVYWAAGGTAGKAAAIPSANGKPLLRPTALLTACVAGALFLMAALVAAAAGRLATPLPPGVLKGAAGLLALIFLGRGVGDFRYVGLFKRVKGSAFATLDTWVYAPLCLALAAWIGAVALA
jgi:hypothetical protein